MANVPLVVPYTPGHHIHPKPSPIPARLRLAATGVLAGLTGGLLLGILNRIYQRITALMGGLHPEFTWGGTLMIIIATLLMAIPAGFLFPAARRRLAESKMTWVEGRLPAAGPGILRRWGYGALTLLGAGASALLFVMMVSLLAPMFG